MLHMVALTPGCTLEQLKLENDLYACYTMVAGSINQASQAKLLQGCHAL
jgi:hypothetical protein